MIQIWNRYDIILDMNEKQIVNNILNKNGVKWNVKDFDIIVNPSCKSSKSICDKVLRNYNSITHHNFYSMADAKLDDLLRLTIVVEYKEMINLIDRIKLSFPDLTGYFQIEEAGYRGIHINLTLNGICCEIQLTPKIAVMAIDYLHTLYVKWRNFNAEKELQNINSLEQIELSKAKSEKQKQIIFSKFNIQRQELDKTIQDEMQDRKKRISIYSEIYNIAKFDYWKPKIETKFFEINNELSRKAPLTNKEIHDILNENLINNGSLNKLKLAKLSKKLERLLNKEQSNFITILTQSINI